MRIRFLSGPNAGKFDHAPRNQNTDLLIKAGAIEVIPDEVKPGIVTWGVVVSDIDGRVGLVGNCSNACAIFRFIEGNPEHLHQHFFQHSCGGTMPTPVPKEMIEKYRAAWKRGLHPTTQLQAEIAHARFHRPAADRAEEAQFNHEHPTLTWGERN